MMSCVGVHNELSDGLSSTAVVRIESRDLGARAKRVEKLADGISQGCGLVRRGSS
jgi:hypothetical protein